MIIRRFTRIMGLCNLDLEKLTSDKGDLILFILRPKQNFEYFPSISDSENMLPRHISPEVLSALQGVRFIAQHIKDADKDNEV